MKIINLPNGESFRTSSDVAGEFIEKIVSFGDEVTLSDLNELELDKVGELSSLLGCLWKVKQDRINKKYINFFGIYELP